MLFFSASLEKQAAESIELYIRAPGFLFGAEALRFKDNWTCVEWGSLGYNTARMSCPSYLANSLSSCGSSGKITDDTKVYHVEAKRRAILLVKLLCITFHVSVGTKLLTGLDCNTHYWKPGRALGWNRPLIIPACNVFLFFFSVMTHC